MNNRSQHCAVLAYGKEQGLPPQRRINQRVHGQEEYAVAAGDEAGAGNQGQPP